MDRGKKPLLYPVSQLRRKRTASVMAYVRLEPLGASPACSAGAGYH